MRLTRCFVETPLQISASIELPTESAHYLSRVLRLKTGDRCILFNGDGNNYPAELQLEGKKVFAQITEIQPQPTESPLSITLIQGVARGEKMDFILQKATELGVTSIIPVVSERTEVKLDAERAQKRYLHWKSVIISACEQSGRAVIPQLNPVSALAEGAQVSSEARLILDPYSKQRLSHYPFENLSSVCLAIGPEGGWSDNDIEILQAAGFNGVQLGARILRTETAGLAAISVLQAIQGDF